jgi:spore germination protein GerM
MTINIYMVAPEGSTLTGKPIDCNDILVPISKTILIEKNEVESALTELFAAKDTDELKNYIKGPGLILYQATVSDGIAEVYIKGDFAITSLCHISRIHEQLYETAKQFPDVKEVKIFINAQSLESYLSISKQGFN